MGHGPGPTMVVLFYSLTVHGILCGVFYLFIYFFFCVCVFVEIGGPQVTAITILNFQVSPVYYGVIGPTCEH